MAKVIVGITISLDGFVAGQNGNAGRHFPACCRTSPARFQASGKRRLAYRIRQRMVARISPLVERLKSREVQRIEIVRGANSAVMPGPILGDATAIASVDAHWSCRTRLPLWPATAPSTIPPRKYY
jgi:hypothetical protein